MISNRHIRRDFSRWIDQSLNNSVRTMCGMRSTDKFCGIPGVTEQPLVVARKRGKNLPGWCYECCVHAAAEIAQFFGMHGTTWCPPELYTLYSRAADVLLAMKIEYSKDFLYHEGIVRKFDPCPTDYSPKSADYVRNSTNPLYRIWSGMLTRCYDVDFPGYRDYGGRGIRVCDRWHQFENFVDDVGHRPDGLSIDRIDVNGDYNPENVRWATALQQARNKRVTA